jgi:CHASE2 domain-containing sensor protein
MNARNSGVKGARFWLSSSITATLAALVGVALFHFPIGGGVTRTSYDLPFALRGNLPVTNVAVIYMDEASHAELKQPVLLPWDRSLHAQLIEQLSAAGARAIVFDILFTEPSADPAADERLAKAILESGRVILAGNYLEAKPVPDVVFGREELPYDLFSHGAAGWGNANFFPDPDYGIRIG